MSPTIAALTTTAAGGCALVGGVFFAFSSFVMNGLSRASGPAGLEAMQGINIAAVRPLFMTALFGTGIACAALGVRGALTLDQPGSALLIVGGAVYVVGTVGVTIVFNVPLNSQLAELDASAAGVEVWRVWRAPVSNHPLPLPLDSSWYEFHDFGLAAVVVWRHDDQRPHRPLSFPACVRSRAAIAELLGCRECSHHGGCWSSSGRYDECGGGVEPR
jgi:uncharacterized membrane protein